MSQNNPEDASTVEIRDQSVGDTFGAGGASSTPVGQKRQWPLTFRDMQLTVGDRLQVQFPAHLQVPRTYVRLVGHVDKQSVLVTAPVHKGLRVPLLENEVLVIRAFARQSAFLFSSSVLRVCRLPFDYLHLGFPADIKGTVIRKATRVRASVPVEIVTGGGEHAGEIFIDNLSASGALIVAPAPLGNKGDILRLRFSLDIHGCRNDVELDARLRYLDLIPNEAGLADVSQQHGFEFEAPEPPTMMLLKGYVYQQIIERPNSLI